MNSNNLNNQETVRKQREREIIRIVLKGKPVSRAMLSRLTMCNKSTTSSIVNSLIEMGLIEEKRRGSSTPRGGKRPGILGITENNVYIIGAWFEKMDMSISVAVYDLKGKVRKENKIKFDRVPDRSKVLDSLTLSLNELKDSMKVENPIGRILYVCLAIGGRVDVREGKIIKIMGWQSCLDNLKIRDKLMASTGLPVYIEDRAVLSAYFEYYMGMAVEEKNFVFLQVMPAIRAFLFFNGEIHYGRNFIAGQIGASLWKFRDRRSEYLCDIIEHDIFGVPEVMDRGHNPSNMRRVSDFINGHYMERNSQPDCSKLGVVTGEILVNLITYYDFPLIILGGIPRKLHGNFFDVISQALEKYLYYVDIRDYKICFETEHPEKRGLGFLFMGMEKMF